MKERLILFVRTYFLFVCIFVVQKPLFMLCYRALYAGDPWTDWLRVMWHGLPLDLSLAAYLTALPGLLLSLAAWTMPPALRRVLKVYFLSVSVLLSLIFVADLALYGYWGFRLDATALFYFLSSPREALASVSVWFVLGGLLAAAACALLLGRLFLVWVLGKAWRRMKVPYHRLGVSSALLLLTGLLFVPIRGGFTVSTMNTGKVYFSTRIPLDHAATNPAFSLMESLSKQKDFASQYRFMAPGEACRLFAALTDPAARGAAAGPAGSPPAAAADTLFGVQRPDVCIVILEGFSSRLMTALGGVPGIAVQMDSLAREGVLFTNFYANSFRTDRGLVSILSGYPAQPTTSIMKYPRKTQNLPSVAGALKKAGYSARYYYGGDADFTNMRSYLRASGFEDIVADRDFPVADRLSKWGVHDHLLFRRLLDDLKEDTSALPSCRVIQTSSSHEPFEVPYRRLKDDAMNSFAYTDSCVGDFIRQYRELPRWKNTVVILVPDHMGAAPEPVDNFMEERYRIPLLMVGGAVARPRRIDVYGSQQDIAATLLAQLGLGHEEFLFSKDLMNPVSPHFAFFTVPDAFGMATADNCLIFDNTSGRVVLDRGERKGANLRAGQAYLQKLYDDLAAR